MPKSTDKSGLLVNSFDEQALHAIFHQAGSGIIQADLEGNILRANSKFCEIVKRPIDMLLKMKISDITYAEDLAMTEAILDRILDEGEKLFIEKRYILPDGSLKWVAKSISLMRDNEGNPSHFIAIVNDISDRKNIEDALKKSSYRFEAIFNQASVGIAQTDLTGRFLLVNERYCKLTGRTEEELLKTNMQTITHPGDLERKLELFNKAVREGKVYTLEKRYVRPDGSVVWASNSVSPVKNAEGIVYNILIIAQDITAQKKYKAELNLNEDRLQALVNQATVGIAQMDLEGKVLLANDMYCNIVGRKDDEVIGLNIYSITHPDDLELNKSYYSHLVKTGEPFTIEKRYLKPDGSIVWVHKSVSLIRGNEEREPFVVAVVQDITQNKLASEALALEREKLEVRVKERTAELASSNAALIEEISIRKKAEKKLMEAQNELIQAEKLAALGRIAANIAHEIRNPLANIRASSQFIMKKLNTNPQVSSLLEIIVKNTETANDKIKEVLDFVSTRSIELEPGDIVSVVNNVYELVSPRCLENHVICKINAPKEDIPFVKFNEKKIHEALLNLVTNSFDAMPEGGSLNIEASYDAGTHSVSVTVKDTGSGITKENLDKVFEPFFTTKHTGIGLGLSLVHKIVELHRGKLAIKSLPGEGTEVTITLPAEN